MYQQVNTSFICSRQFNEINQDTETRLICLLANLNNIKRIHSTWWVILSLLHVPGINNIPVREKYARLRILSISILSKHDLKLCKHELMIHTKMSFGNRDRQTGTIKQIHERKVRNLLILNPVLIVRQRDSTTNNTNSCRIKCLNPLFQVNLQKIDHIYKWLWNMNNMYWNVKCIKRSEKYNKKKNYALWLIQ